MRQISASEFLLNVEAGYIIDIFAVGRRVYGKDWRGTVEVNRRFEVVWADVP